MVRLFFLGSMSETKTPSTSPGGNALHKKSILVGKRPGLGVSSMLSQFKSYSQSKKNPVLSQRPSVFCSPDDDEEEDADYSKFLEMKGNSRPVFQCFSGHLHGLDISVHLLRTPVVQLPCDWHFVINALRVNVLIACLKSLPQRIQTPDSLSTRWHLLWQRGDLNWRKRPRRTTETILFSRKSEGHCSLLIYFTRAVFSKLTVATLPFRFLYDKSSMEYLYYKNRVAELRRDLLKPENTSDNGKITSSHPLSLFSLFYLFSQKYKNITALGWTVCQYNIVHIVSSYHNMTSQGHPQT